jgi:hypothetical protein
MDLAEGFESRATTKRPASVVNPIKLSPIMDTARFTEAFRVNLGPIMDTARFTEAFRVNLGPIMDTARMAAAFDVGPVTDALRTPSLDLAAVDDLLGHVQQMVVTGVDEDAELAGVPLTQIWMESFADLRAWLRRPIVRGIALSLAFAIISFWWMNLKAYHPEVADLIEVPLWTVVSLLIGMAIKK